MFRQLLNDSFLLFFVFFIITYDEQFRPLTKKEEVPTILGASSFKIILRIMDVHLLKL